MQSLIRVYRCNLKRIGNKNAPKTYELFSFHPSRFKYQKKQAENKGNFRPILDPIDMYVKKELTRLVKIPRKIVGAVSFVIQDGEGLQFIGTSYCSDNEPGGFNVPEGIRRARRRAIRKYLEAMDVKEEVREKETIKRLTNLQAAGIIGG